MEPASAGIVSGSGAAAEETSGGATSLPTRPGRPRGSAATPSPRIKRIPPRVDAALNAVPAAVLTTLVVPAAVFQGTAETLTLVLCLAIGFRLPLMGMFFIGWAIIVALRASGL